uniref:glutaredoxin family protein n=1 Tax=Microbulbifer agarilyticus TaxID=260552 RepID=UPI000255B79D|nr:glutaredoxin family protein [Microbulbifer agarilyticus]
MAERDLLLYTTLGCTLCEKAKQEIWPLLEKYQLRLVSVDIADDETLTRLFGWSIPVVGLGSVDDVICWPFTVDELDQWLVARLA